MIVGNEVVQRGYKAFLSLCHTQLYEVSSCRRSPWRAFEPSDQDSSTIALLSLNSLIMTSHLGLENLGKCRRINYFVLNEVEGSFPVGLRTPW